MLEYKLQTRKDKVSIVYYTMRIVIFRSEKLQFDYTTKLIKLTKVAILIKSGYDILSFFDIAFVSYPFRNTKHDRSRPENRIETHLIIKEIKLTEVCCHPDGSNRSANAIRFGCIKRGKRRKKKAKGQRLVW